MTKTPYLNKDSVIKLYKTVNTGHVYQKSGRMLARPAQIGETVITVVSGKVETLKGATVGDWILRNISVGSSAETYIIAGDVFEKRYSWDDVHHLNVDGFNWYDAHPKGQIIGGFYDWDAAVKAGIVEETLDDMVDDGSVLEAPTVRFEAPWGEDMLLEDGDYLGRPYPAENYDDIYRIGRQDFEATYGTEPVFGTTTAEKVMA